MVNNTWILIYKKLNNTATPEELEEIDEILREDAGIQYPFALLEHLWQMNKVSGTKNNEPSEEKWQILQAQINKPREINVDSAADPVDSGESETRFPIFKTKVLLIAAAAVILICSVLVLFVSRTPSDKDGICEIKVPMGGMTNVQLPDGSTIILNAGSRLTYKNTFDAKHREVRLSGEAFFDIVKDPAHPFVVFTPMIKIRVLGTRFNVKAYPGDKISEAALIRGIIELTVLKNPDRQIILKPSEKLTLINSETGGPKPKGLIRKDTLNKAVIELGTIHQMSKDSLPTEAGWIKNKVVFEGTTFEEVAKMMERKYSTTIVFKRDELKNITLTGKFENVTLDKALQQLKLIASFNYQIINNQVFIY